MDIDRFLNIARCPQCGGGELARESDVLIGCKACGANFEIRDDVPRMVPRHNDNSANAEDDLRKESYEYWDGGIPGTVENGYQAGKVSAEPGTKDWYEQGDVVRYNQYKALAGFGDFDRYKGAKVLDIGPGRGQDAHNYLKAGANLTVLEYAGQGVDIVRERFRVYGEDVDLVQGDAVAIPCKDATFDLVFSYGVLHHIPDMEKSISEVFRVLKPGGHAKIMIYHKGYFYYKDMFLKWYIMKGNFLRHSWDEYKKIAMEQRSGPCPVVYIKSNKDIKNLFKDFDIVGFFNAEIIEGRLVRWGIIPRFIVNRFSNFLGAYSHITLKKPMG